MFEEINRRCFFGAKAMTRSLIYKLLLAGFVIAVVCATSVGIRGQSADPASEPGAAGKPYPNMPSIAPIGVRIGKYLDVPSSSQGPPIDPAKGYRVQDLGSGLYMITDNAIQSMFLVYDRGVVVIDAPQNLAVSFYGPCELDVNWMLKGAYKWQIQRKQQLLRVPRKGSERDSSKRS